MTHHLLSKCEPCAEHCGCACIVSIAEAVACCTAQHDCCHTDGDADGCNACDTSLGFLLDALQAQVDALRGCHTAQKARTAACKAPTS